MTSDNPHLPSISLISIVSTHFLCITDCALIQIIDLDTMVEAVGLTIGIAGLAGTFNACLEAFSLFHAGRS